ncbi:MAG: Hpt domain-containing protein [Planctomycetota bacterium]
MDREYTVLMDGAGGDHNLVAELIIIFRNQYPDLITRMDTAIDNRQADELRLAAHTLKGMLAHFGPGTTLYLTKTIENLAVLAEFAEAGLILQKLIPRLKRLDEQMASWQEASLK